MPRKKKADTDSKKATDTSVLDYRYDATRKNIPSAGLAAQGVIRETPKMKYAYDPHLPPSLRFDPTGSTDSLPELLRIAQTRKLTPEEAQQLSEAIRHREPWLEWAGKQERKGFEVEPVALHIHERIATQAILKVAAREDIQRDIFADPQLEYQKAVQFYQHDVDWSNRMILGDSLQVIASIARREGLAGQVQMIYMDPPYGIKFASNFQPEIGKRDVKDRESDLTREPEMVKAYRDTWTLGVHSYLAYLRDRLILCRELLADSGSFFVQIGDENLHHVREVLDEVFGPHNLCSVITVVKTAGQSAELVPNVCDYLLWYAKSKDTIKFKQTFREKAVTPKEAGHYGWLYHTTGETRGLRKEERDGRVKLPEGTKLYAPTSLTSQGGSAEGPFPFEYAGQTYTIAVRDHWKTNKQGMSRIAQAGRIHVAENSIRFVRFLDDFPAIPHTNFWDDTATGNFTELKIYVVQTASKIIERCLLMTTDPGDLVLDPTCGSGTTAYVAEQWGRRWITIDASRVALALARQRLMTATFPFHKVRTSDASGQPSTDEINPSNGFIYKTVPHITLKSIAQNVALDAIFARHQPLLDEKLTALNAALKKAPSALRQRLLSKMMEKEKREGKRAVTDADRRRWMLPKEGWKTWEIPFDADDEWPEELKTALSEYRSAWRAKMEEVNACIAANADQEELVDQPEPLRGVTRVSGPFTMEAVMPAEESMDTASPIGGEPEELETFGQMDGSPSEAVGEPVNAEAYLDKMLRLLQSDGVRFPNNKVMKFTRLEPCSSDYLHAEGEWITEGGETRIVAVSLGPQFGPVTAFQVENALPLAMDLLRNNLTIWGEVHTY